MKIKTPLFFALLFLIGTLLCCYKCSSVKENRTDHQDGSGITSIPLTSQRINDLSVLGKVWGFLKYYHPEVAKGKYNWDNELFKILPGIIACKNEKERNDILVAWIDTLGKFNVGAEAKFDPVKVKCLPDLEWITNTAMLGDKLSKQLKDIKVAKRTGKNYYVSLEPSVKNPSFHHEDLYSNLHYPDAGYRLLCLFRYWNMIQYFYPDKYLIGEDWKNVLDEYIPKIIEAKDDLAYKIVVSDLIAAIHDTHANISSQDSVWLDHVGRNISFVQTAYVEDKIIVTGFYSKDAEENSGLKVGDIILEINQKPTVEIIAQSMPHAHASNIPTVMRNIAAHIFHTNDSLLNITYQRGNEKGSVKLSCYTREQFRANYKEGYKKDTCFQYLRPDIGYIYPGTINSDYFPTVMPGMLQTKGIVIDMRCYPSEFIIYKLGKYFMPNPIPFVTCTNGSIQTPGLFQFDGSLYIGESNRDYYKGKIVIIINEETQSQAEWTTMGFRRAPNATVIGSTTAGADGNYSSINLVGGIQTGISGIGVYYPDGRETQRIGIVPDIEIHPTIQGIRDGRDELLEKAIELITQ